MEFELYSEILNECPLPYVYGRAIKDENKIIKDFIIKDLNDKGCNLLNIRPGDIKDKSIKELIPCILDKNLKYGKEDKNLYIPYLGGWYTISISLVNENNYIMWFVENNETKKINAIQLLGDTISDYIFYKDVDSRIISCNKSYAEELVELDKSEIIGKTVKDIPVIDEYSNIYRVQDLEVMKSKTEKTYYDKVILKNGKLINLETVKTPIISEEGEVLGIVGISRNINERKKCEEEIEKARSESLANVAHELRTPLNLIFSSVQMLNHRYEIINNKTKIKDDKYLNIIKQNGYRLLKLVDNLIDSTKFTYQNIEFNPQNYDIVNFVESICESVSDFANQKEMNIVFDTDVEEKIIGFDLDKMERIVLNLLSNALKFNSSGKSIEVFVKDLSDNIQIRVKDGGIGIPEKDLYKVFDKFKQIDQKNIDNKVGSGIGLSLVKTLAELHGGSVDVKSKLGIGSEFIVNIPNNTYSDKVNLLDENSLKEKFVQKIEVEFSDIYA